MEQTILEVHSIDMIVTMNHIYQYRDRVKPVLSQELVTYIHKL